MEICTINSPKHSQLKSTRKVTTSHSYDVAFSFAGEDRSYVEKVANCLKSSNIIVFYDAFEQIDLWGKDLYSHLDKVYREEARYCVIFISEAYRKKLWTNHERESAQARAFQENSEYILPARFDDTEIPGIRPTVGYIDLRNLKPQEFAHLILQKLDASASVKRARDESKVPHTRSHKKIAKAHKQESKRSKRKNASRTKTVNFSKEGIEQLPNDKSVVYKILTEGGKNNYTGVATRGKVQATLQQHLPEGKSRVPGSRIHIERMDNIEQAREKAKRILNRTKPKYNT